jgi:hypothetical protein
MRLLFSGQIPKDPNYPEELEDAMCVSLGENRVAVSDGASESFDSKEWAELLANGYIEDPRLGVDWLRKQIEHYGRAVDSAALSWSKKAAFERGSFATLLGLQHCPESCIVDVLGIGDSLAALCDCGELLDTFPYTRSDQFEQRPELLSTNGVLNSRFELPGYFLECHKKWDTTEKQEPVVLLMTDALAHWALRSSEQGNPVWRRLIEIKERSTLESLVLEEREVKNMRVDDVTLVGLSLRE